MTKRKMLFASDINKEKHHVSSMLLILYVNGSKVKVLGIGLSIYMTYHSKRGCIAKREPLILI